ncbi:MAG: DUF423 domain-containing protein [Rubricoccaceae bacterium]
MSAEDAGRLLVALGAVSAALGVAAGAFGAHALAGAVSPERLATFRTGAQYQQLHAVAMVLAGLAAAWRPGWRGATRAGWLFLAGTLLFSGSLYALVLTDTPALGAVAPFGGVAFMAGWLVLAWTAWTARRAS